jgi:hypothetical protein
MKNVLDNLEQRLQSLQAASRLRTWSTDTSAVAEQENSFFPEVDALRLRRGNVAPEASLSFWLPRRSG